MLELTEKEWGVLWKSGRLRVLLKPNQRPVYDHFQNWHNTTVAQRAKGEVLPGRFPRLYVFDCSRRWGKDFSNFLILLEKAYQRKNGVFVYASCYMKDIMEIAASVSTQLTATCPEHLRPVYKSAYRGLGQGFHLPNGSFIKLVGLDVSPDQLRGRHLDAAVVSEGAFVSDLEKTIEEVLEPQMLGRPHAFILLNSTPSESFGDWDKSFVPDSIDRGAYIMRTIYQSHYEPHEIQEFLKVQPDGTIPNRQQREFLCIRVREQTKVVVPEFDEKKHVKEFELPKYAQCFVGIDPAIKDLSALIFAVWDFENHRLLIVDEKIDRNLNTLEIAEALRAKERQHFTGLHWWDGKKLRENPVLRITDIDAGGTRMLTDLGALHNITCVPADKTGAEASLQALRLGFQYDQVWIHPRCTGTIEQFKSAIWNKSRSSYERTERLGHCDAVDAAKYLWRGISKQVNPFPPHAFGLIQKNGRHDIYLRPDHLVTKSGLIPKLNNLFPARWKKTP